MLVCFMSLRKDSCTSTISNKEKSEVIHLPFSTGLMKVYSIQSKIDVDSFMVKLLGQAGTQLIRVKQTGGTSFLIRKNQQKVRQFFEKWVMWKMKPQTHLSNACSVATGLQDYSIYNWVSQDTMCLSSALCYKTRAVVPTKMPTNTRKSACPRGSL